MFENQTYDEIRNRMLQRVLDYDPNIDVREGSMMWNAVSPAALELAYQYTFLDNVLAESFPGTASREYLYLHCDQMGIDTTIFEATYAQFYADFNVQVAIGSRWNYDQYNYEVTEYVGEVENHYRYFVKCETAGLEPNGAIGTLTPIDAPPTGLEYATLVSCEIFGENEWSNDTIREYYFTHVKNQSLDGNIAQYELWCQNFEGIGNYKIFPLWNGVNTVKVSILGATNTPASSTLVTDFQVELDPPNAVINDTKTHETYPQGRGMGNGKAPVGAIVTVSTATELPINVSAVMSLKAGYSEDTVETNINNAITAYLQSIAYEQSKVPYMGLGAAIISAEGVDYISNLTVNDGTSDITLGDEACPVLGTTVWTVASA